MKSKAEDEDKVVRLPTSMVGKQTPFGLPRFVIALIYCVVVMITGMAVQAADPLQMLLKMNGAYSSIVDPVERKGAIASIIGAGLSCCVLCGVIVGPLVDFLGAKLSALLGISLHCAAYSLLFLVNIEKLYYLASLCFGCGFLLILTSHLSVGSLFKNNANFIVALLGAAPDISLFIPATMLSIAQSRGGTAYDVRSVVTQYLLYFCSVALTLDIVFLPWKAFTGVHDPEVASDNERRSLMAADNDDSKIVVEAEDSGPLKRNSAKVAVAPSSQPDFADFTLTQQLLTPDYWFFIVYFVVTFARKKNFAIFIREILAELDSDPTHAHSGWMTDIFNRIVPYGFVPAIGWGALVERIGMTNIMHLSNGLAIAFCALSLIPVLQLQFVTIVVFLLYQSFVFGQITAFLITFYGFKNLASLQGIAATVVGLCTIAIDHLWIPFVQNTLKSHRIANSILTGLGVALIGIPFLLDQFQKRRKRGRAAAKYTAFKGTPSPSLSTSQRRLSETVFVPIVHTSGSAAEL